MNCNIDTNYPGGNIHVISINDDRVHVEQELRDTEPWWFYWNFRVQVQGKAEITFTFENGEVVGPFGPAISKDGVHWYYDKKTTFLDHQSFRFAFQEETVYFAFSIPYQYAQFETFYEQNKENPLLTRHLFAVSEKGRDIPLLKIGKEHSGRHIWLTCRHHACESCASYVLEGVLSYLLHVPNPLVQRCLVHVLPFIDIDGVEDGDQGKGRIPHDHNRDYQQQPIYNVTKALYQYTENRPILMGFDFHDPGKWGGYQEINDHWSIVEGPQPYLKPQRQFSHILEDVAREETLYSVQNNSVFGVDWNTQLQPSAWNFFFKRGAKVAFSLETPYFGDRAEPYSQDMLRHLGEKFAIAMQRYEEQYLKE